MRTVHLSTVGKSPEPIIDGFRTHTVDHQILLFSKQTAEVARKIKQQIGSLSAREMCDLVEVDPFSMYDIVSLPATLPFRRNRGNEEDLGLVEKNLKDFPASLDSPLDRLVLLWLFSSTEQCAAAILPGTGVYLTPDTPPIPTCK